MPRPKLSPEHSRTVTIAIKLLPSEAGQVESAITASGSRRPDWLRHALLYAARSHAKPLQTIPATEAPPAAVKPQPAHIVIAADREDSQERQCNSPVIRESKDPTNPVRTPIPIPDMKFYQ